jgi:hypothetical protein
MHDNAVLNRPPVADAGPDQILRLAGGQHLARVRLDGTGSNDVDGNLAKLSWLRANQEVGTEAVVELDLPAGVHEIFLNVSDSYGSSVQDSLTVTVSAL